MRYAQNFIWGTPRIFVFLHAKNSYEVRGTRTSHEVHTEYSCFIWNTHKIFWLHMRYAQKLMWGTRYAHNFIWSPHRIFVLNTRYAQNFTWSTHKICVLHASCESILCVLHMRYAQNIRASYEVHTELHIKSTHGICVPHMRHDTFICDVSRDHMKYAQNFICSQHRIIVLHMKYAQNFIWDTTHSYVTCHTRCKAFICDVTQSAMKEAILDMLSVLRWEHVLILW